MRDSLSESTVVPTVMMMMLTTTTADANPRSEAIGYKNKTPSTYRRFEQFIVVLTRAGDDVGAARRLRDGRLGGNLDAGERGGRGEHGCGRDRASESDGTDVTNIARSACVVRGVIDCEYGFLVRIRCCVQSKR